MYVSPNHPNPPRTAPPEDNDPRLATFRRQHGCELRVSLSSYNGYPYVRLQIWERGQVDTSQLWPARGKAISIRRGELEPLIVALMKAQDTLDSGGALESEPAPEPDRAEDRPQYVPKRGRPDVVVGGAEHYPRPRAETFDEFGGPTR